MADVAYDDLGNPIPESDLRGKVVGGKCGMLTCGCSGASYSYYHPDRGEMFVCAYCADEINGRVSRGLFGRATDLPCVPVPKV